MSIQLFCDIDEVIATTYKKDNQRINEFFVRKGSIIDADGKRHGIAPGMIELFQRFYGESTISKISSFSAGSFRRNGEFWMTFLKQTMSREKYKELKKRKVQILSKHELSEKKTKQLNPLVENGTLKNTLHIDDTPKVVHPGEEPNVLLTYRKAGEVFLQQNTDSIAMIANQACYIAGLIFTAKEEAARQSISVSEALFKLQYEVSTDPSILIPIYGQLLLEDRIYRRGLPELQKMNPDFNFIQPHYDSFDNNTPLIKRLKSLRDCFQEHLEKKEYGEAFKRLNEMLDLVEHKSGRWMHSSELVCVYLCTIVEEVCSHPDFKELSAPLLQIILDIPRDNERNDHVDIYLRKLKKLPVELRPQALVTIIETYCDEFQHHQAMKWMEELLKLCKAKGDYSEFEKGIEFISSSKIRKKHQQKLLQLIKEIPDVGSRIKLLNVLSLSAINRKIQLQHDLLHYHLENKDGEAALKAFSKALEAYPEKTKIDLIHQFRIDLLSLAQVTSISIDQILAVIDKAKDKELKAVLKALACRFLPDQQISSFKKIYSESKPLSARMNYSMIFSGHTLIEQAIENKTAEPAEILDLLVEVLDGYVKTTIISDQKDVFGSIKKFLCEQPPSLNRSRALVNLSKVYWKNILHKESLNLVQEIQKAPAHHLVDPLLFSLIHYQYSRLYQPFDEKDLPVYSTKDSQEIAKAVFLDTDSLSKTLFWPAFWAINHWKAGDHDKALSALGIIEGSSELPELRSKLLYCTIDGICDLGTISEPSRLIEMAKRIPDPIYQYSALHRIETALKN